MQKIEEIALSKLILDENYCRQVLPFVKEEYFDTINHKILFEVVHKYVQEFDLFQADSEFVVPFVVQRLVVLFGMHLKY